MSIGSMNYDDNDSVSSIDKHRIYNGVMLLNPQLLANFEIEDNFQADGKGDFYIISDFSNSEKIIISPKELYVDALFMNSFQIRTGLFIIDYGNNSYFHPLNIIEFLPDFEDRFGLVVYGTEKLGYLGVPSAKMRYSLPLPQDLVRIAIELCSVFHDFKDVGKNYFLPAIHFASGALQLSSMVGISEKKVSSYAFDASYIFPINILVFGEFIAKNGSRHLVSVSDGQNTKRSGWSCNYSIRAEYQFTTPLLGNTFNVLAEGFHFSEGLTKNKVGNLLDELDTIDNNRLRIKYRKKLFQKERTFDNYIQSGLKYTILKWRTQLEYQTTFAVKSLTTDHLFQLGKEYKAARFAVSYNFPTGYGHTRLGMNSIVSAKIMVSLQ